MKTASSNSQQQQHHGPSARLELLCRTAIGEETKKKCPIVAFESPVSTIQQHQHHGFLGKPLSSVVKNKAIVPALSLEPPSMSTATTTTTATAAATTTTTTTTTTIISTHKSWAPSSFVDLKSSRKALSLVPAASSSSSIPQKAPQRVSPIQPASPTASSSQHAFSSSLSSMQQQQPKVVVTSCVPKLTTSSSSPTSSTIKQQQQQLVAQQAANNKSAHPSSFKQLIGENVRLKIELGEAKKEISRLKKEMNKANYNINELRSMSGNKISEIPLADMIQIMQEYGSEVSGQSFQRRKDDPQPASIVRQFRRWNPDFLKYFFKKNGKWVPKLGKAGELQRRRQKREALRAHRRNPPGGAQTTTTTQS